MSSPDGTPSNPLSRALLRWQDAAGPWWPYVCATPFLSELTVGEPGLSRARLPTLLAHALDASDDARMTAIYVDLTPETTLAAVPILNERGYAVVPVIQRWAVKPAVISCERLLMQLIAMGERARFPTRERGVVFLLDGRRFGASGPSIQGASIAPRARRFASVRRFDNRYQYPICRLPPVALLRHLGITRTVWVPELVAPDLRPYANRLAEAGLGPVGAANVIPTRSA